MTRIDCQNISLHDAFEFLLKSTFIQFIYKGAQQSGKLVFCIVDSTISSKTNPSSRALHPIEDAYFHQSHLKEKQNYRHQAVAVMLSYNSIVLNYVIVMYDKSKSKVKIVQEIADELPVPPVVSYLFKHPGNLRVLAAMRQYPSKMAMLIFKAISRKNISISSTSVEQGILALSRL